MLHKILLGLLLGTLLLAPAAFASFTDNFDSYGSHVASPGPWTSSAEHPACFYARTQSNSSANSLPNMYQWTATTTAPCNTGNQHADLSLQTKATGIESISWYQRSFGTPLSGTFKLTANHTTIYTITASTITTSWTKVTATVNSTVGKVYDLNFSWYNTAAVGNKAYLTIDNFGMTGGNVWTTGANFFLNDFTSGGLFNITHYAGSYVQVNFPTGSPTVYNNVVIPDFVASTTGSSLAVTWVGSNYFVPIIPSSGTNNVYLLAPGLEDAYTIAVQDLSGHFGSGSQVYLKLGSLVMASGYLDAGNNFVTWAPPGSYTIEIVSGSNTFTENLNLPSVSGSTVTVQILKISVVGNCGVTCTVSYGAAFTTPSAITVGFNDTTGSSTSVTDSVYRRNATGTFLFYTHTWTSGPYGTLIDTVSCATRNCNSTIAGQLFITLSYTDTFGTQSVNFGVTGGGVSTIPDIPNTILGWNSIFGNSVTPLSFVSFFLIIMAAAISGVYSAKFGAIVVAGVIGMLSYFGWFTPGGGLLTLVGSLAVMAFVAYLEAGR